MTAMRISFIKRPDCWSGPFMGLWTARVSSPCQEQSPGTQLHRDHRLPQKGAKDIPRTLPPTSL